MLVVVHFHHLLRIAFGVWMVAVVVSPLLPPRKLNLDTHPSIKIRRSETTWRFSWTGSTRQNLQQQQTTGEQNLGSSRQILSLNGLGTNFGELTALVVSTLHLPAGLWEQRNPRIQCVWATTQPILVLVALTWLNFTCAIRIVSLSVTVTMTITKTNV